MAGSRKGNSGSGKRSGATRTRARKAGAGVRPASAYAREAVSEWGKAVRHAAAALRPSDRPRLKERLGKQSGRGGRLGDVADRLLSKMGAPGAAAAKLGVGSRVVGRMRGGQASSKGGGETNGSWDGEMPIPIQESMEVAVPVRTAYALCMRFEDYPEFIDRVESVERIDDATVAFEARVRGAVRRIEVEMVDERPNRRVDWEGTGDFAHSGVISFHELAPSLTHIELTIDLEPQDVLQRITRAAHLTERAIRADMHRLKAYAELWQEEEEEDVEPEAEDQEEPEVEADAADEEEFEDEEEPDEYAEDEEEPEPVEAG
jgi:uncharacterized membrane protein